MPTLAPAMGLNGAISTPHHIASQVGLRVLEDGGNALDACVAACAVLGVVLPDNCGIGGDLFLLIYSAREGRLFALNASGRAGAKATPELVRSAGHQEMPDRGALSIVVPGCVHGWHTALERFGTRELGALLQPAIDVAEGGFAASLLLVDSLTRFSDALNDGARRMLMPNGRCPPLGDSLRMPEYAASLRQIARGGPGALYGGPLGDALGRFVESQGGHVTAEDIAAHSSDWVDPIGADFRGYEVCTIPPNSQSVLHLMALRVLDPMGLGQPLSAHNLSQQIEAMRVVYRDRPHIADPAFAEVPVQWMLSDEHAKEMRADLASEGPTLLAADIEDTVYLAAADRDGNVVSMIQSLRRVLGSGLVAPGTGILLNDRARDFGLDPDDPNCLAPRKRPRHTLSPCLALREGGPAVVYGAAGGGAQPPVMLQLSCNLLASGMNPQSALDAPRWTLTPPDWGPDAGSLALEGHLPEDTKAGLLASGYVLDEMPEVHEWWGRGAVIEIDHERGVFLAGIDPRSPGAALAF